MSEKCVITMRVMLDTDQEEKAQEVARHLIEDFLYYRRHILDAEVTGYSFHGGRSFLYRDPSTTTKGDA